MTDGRPQPVDGRRSLCLAVSARRLLEPVTRPTPPTHPLWVPFARTVRCGVGPGPASPGWSSGLRRWWGNTQIEDLLFQDTNSRVPSWTPLRELPSVVPKGREVLGWRGPTMAGRERLTRLTGTVDGPNCDDDDCPNVYATEHGTFVVQGTPTGAPLCRTAKDS